MDKPFSSIGIKTHSIHLGSSTGNNWGSQGKPAAQHGASAPDPKKSLPSVAPAGVKSALKGGGGGKGKR